MRRDKEKRQIALQVSIALTAGMFSIVPVAYGAPTGGVVKTGDASISYTDTTAGKDTDISSNSVNNVIDWQDFSVAKNENVNFNDSHNYLNIVSGQNTSEINGAINSAGGNIYLVNPNGVIFGKGSSVNVGSTGSFNVSTRYLDANIAADKVDDGKTMSQVISEASSTVASDIVNMGSVTAKSVVLEGNNIRFMNSGTTDNKVTVTDNNITFKANGVIHIGNTDEHVGSETNAVTGYKGQTLTGADNTPVYYQLTSSLAKVTSGNGISNSSGRYMLSQDIETTAASRYTGTFSGKLDGMGFSVKGLNSTDGGGMFTALSGATVENIRVINPSVSGGSGSITSGNGAIAGAAGADSVIRDVFVDGGTIDGPKNYTAGIVGVANGVTLEQVGVGKNTKLASGHAGLIGTICSNSNYIKKSYFSGDADYGFYLNTLNTSAYIDISESYAIANDASFKNLGNSATIQRSIGQNKNQSPSIRVYKENKSVSSTVSDTSEMKYKSLYDTANYYDETDKKTIGWDISNTGGVVIDPTTGAVTRPTWRIYEGQDTPVLTSMLKGIKTAAYEYGYFKTSDNTSLDKNAVVYNPVTGKAGIGANYTASVAATSDDAVYSQYKSKDIPAYDETSEPTGLVYNGETLKIVGQGNKALTTKDVSAFFHTEGSSTVSASDINYDVDGQLNSTYDHNSEETHNLALLWSDQQGYDIVGSNIAISPRTVKAVTDYSETTIEKDYDGKSDASDAFKNLFSGDSTTTTGILAVDKDNVKVKFDGSASFVDADEQADASVGKGKDILFGADSSISLSFEDDSARDNYILSATGSSFEAGTKLTGVGTINQANLYISFASGYGTGIVKEYDHTSAVDDAYKPTSDTFSLTGIIKPEGAAQADNVSIDLTSVQANYIDDDGSATWNAGDHDVRYSGLKLTGTDAGNYRLVVGDKNDYDVIYSVAYNGVGTDVNKDTGGSIDGSGTINKKNLSLGGFSIYDENGNPLTSAKTYNNDPYYDDDSVKGKTVYSDEVVHWQEDNKTVWDDLTFTVTADNAGHYAYFTKEEGSTDSVENAGKNYGVAYHVTIGGASAANYTINQEAIKAGDTKDVTGSGGEIKPRVITLALGDKTTDIDKTYDGDAAVKVTHNDVLTSEISLDDGLVKYANGSKTLISNDGTKLSIVGAYDDKDVVASNEYGIGADQGITYTITVVDGTINGKAANYVFKTEGGASSQTITGATGAINPVHIKDIQFAEVYKDYDKSDKVKGNQNYDKIVIADITDGTKTVLVDGESLTDIFNTSLIDGTYGSVNTDDTFTPNAHVQRDKITNEVISGTVKYMGKDSEGNPTSLRNSIITNNYVLDNDKAYYGVGTINPLTITALTLAKKEEITKAYDGEKSVAYTDVNGNEHEAAEFVGTLSTEVGGESFDLTDKYSVHKAEYASENVAWDGNNVAKQKVTYLLNVVEDGDYTVDDSLKDTTKTYVQIDYTGNDGGTITPRKLKAQAAADFTKTYDATKVIYDGTTELSGNDVVTFIGYDNAAYGLLTKDQNANISTAVYADVDAGENKTINYTAEISGTDTTAKNYEIYVDSGNGNWTKGTAFTKNNGMINKAGLYVTFEDVEKFYDENQYLLDENDQSLINPNYHNGIKTGTNGLDDVHVNFASEKDSFFDSAEVARDGNGQVTSQNVTYKFTLAGETAKNYFIEDGDGKEVTTKDGNKTVLNGRGTIKPKVLTDDDVNLQIDAASKVYDMNSTVTYNHSEAEYGSQAGSKNAADYINTFTIGGVVIKNTDYTAAGLYLNDTGTETAGVDANTARFTISLTDEAVSNFDLSGVSFYSATDKTLTKTTVGTIKPKNVTVSFHDPKVTKVYNGKTDVVTGSTQQNPDGTAMDIGTAILDVNGIFGNDTAALDSTSINARYKTKDVAYNGNNVTSQDVYYDAVLTGDNAQNYQLVYGDDKSTVVNGNPTLTLTGSGTITPKVITADFKYNDTVVTGQYNTKDGDTTANKAYDDDVTVNILASEDIQGVNGEVIQLKDALVEGTYGTWKADSNGEHTGIKDSAGNTETGTFTANGDVNWLGTGSTEEENTGYKAVKYTNLQNALAGAKDKNGTEGFSGKNYTIADTVYFTEAAQKGKIRRLALTEGDVEERWEPITKEYNGNHDVKNPEQNLTIYTMVTGPEVDLKYDLKSAVYDDNQLDVVAAHGVTYTLNNLQAQEFNNFRMDNALLTKYQGKVFKSQTIETNPTNKSIMPSGSITPRVLKINVPDEEVYIKTYDGGDAVKANGNVIDSFEFEYDSDESAILDDDKGTVNLVVTGVYETTDANLTPEGETIQGKSATKNIKYTAKLTGNDAGNYTLDTSGTKAKGDTQENQSAGTGQGAIKQRVVYAGFENGYGSNIDKPYDTDAKADKDDQHKNHIKLLTDTAGETGVIAADTDIELNNANIDANYLSKKGEAAKDVARDSSGNVLVKDVAFTNINLKDSANSGNYAVRAKDGTTTLKGSGTIKPLSVTVTRDNAPTKKYDGNGSIDTNKNNFTATVTDDAGEAVKDFLKISGQYNDVNAGENKPYTYTLSIDGSPNYDLTSTTIKGTDGVIGKRTISANFNNGVLTKVYDGNPYGNSELLTDVTNEVYDATNNTDNSLTNVRFTLNDVVTGDNTLLTGKATFGGKDAGEYGVTYTLTLNNTNYQFADDGSNSVSFNGKGYISRRDLIITATPVSINAGEAMPTFTGTVSGFVDGERDNYTAFINGLTYKTEDGVNTSNPGQYGVYGWYTNTRSGLLGQNYTYSQDPSNSTALTVNYFNRNEGNPDTKITPNSDVYNQISKDMNSGFGDNGAAAIEYQDKGGNVIAMENIDSGEIHSSGAEMGNGIGDMSQQNKGMSNIGIAGGDIVNMEGANAASSANVAVSGDGTTVNLEVQSINADEQSGTNNAVAEITNKDSQTGTANIETVDKGEAINGGAAKIEIRDEKQNILDEENEDKVEKEEKEGQIAIKSSNGEDDDEIELTVEKEGVNVA